MKEAFNKPYIYPFIGIFTLYLVLNIILSGFYDTIPLIIVYASTVSWLKLGLSLILTLSIGFLVAVNAVLVIMRYKERKKCRGAGVAGAGVVGGLIVGVCPLCITGIFPLILGLLGVSFSFASLPFQGLEIQIFIVILLLISLRSLRKSGLNQKI